MTGYGGTFAPNVYSRLMAAAREKESVRQSLDASFNAQMVSDLIGNGLCQILDGLQTEQNVEFLARRFDRFLVQGQWVLIGSPLYVALSPD